MFHKAQWYLPGTGYLPYCGDCSWFQTDNVTFTMVSEYPALGVYPVNGSVPLPSRTYTSFSSAAIETGISR